MESKADQPFDPHPKTFSVQHNPEFRDLREADNVSRPKSRPKHFGRGHTETRVRGCVPQRRARYECLVNSCAHPRAEFWSCLLGLLRRRFVVLWAGNGEGEHGATGLVLLLRRILLVDFRPVSLAQQRCTRQLIAKHWGRAQDRPEATQGRG
jgi:hypothetical protein